MMLRRLTPGEIALARRVFGATLDLRRVRLWFHGLPTRFAVTLGPVITLPGQVRRDFAQSSPADQAWLIHELVHVWQLQTAPLRAISSWARVLVRGGYGATLSGYGYDLPIEWDALNLEQQASVVEDIARLSAGLEPRHGPKSAVLAQYRGQTPFAALFE